MMFQGKPPTPMTDWEGTKISPPGVLGLQQIIETSNKELEMLMASVERLAERISPFLRPGPGSGSPGQPAESYVSSEVGRMLRTQADQIMVARQKITEIADRLDR
jgi:hypothetical protein